MLEGIQYLHSMGVAHRDIKPQNLLVTKTGKVYILDFNVSQKRKEDQKVFTMMTKTGTVAFTAPEVFLATNYT
jgi:serine/threonine protein kinase